MAIADGRQLVEMAAEPVEERQLARGLEQALLVVLSVDLAEPRTQPRQAADGDRAVVDASDRAAVRTNLAPHDDAALPGLHHLAHRVVGR